MSINTPDPRLDAFLAEYEALCRKHGCLLNSCGCCLSPWVEPLSTDPINAERQLTDSIEHLQSEELHGVWPSPSPGEVPVQQPQPQDCRGMPSVLGRPVWLDALTSSSWVSFCKTFLACKPEERGNLALEEIARGLVAQAVKEGLV